MPDTEYPPTPQTPQESKRAPKFGGAETSAFALSMAPHVHITMTANTTTEQLPFVSDQVSKIGRLAEDLRGLGLRVTMHIDLNWTVTEK